MHPLPTHTHTHATRTLLVLLKTNQQGVLLCSSRNVVVMRPFKSQNLAQMLNFFPVLSQSSSLLHSFVRRTSGHCLEILRVLILVPFALPDIIIIIIINAVIILLFSSVLRGLPKSSCSLLRLIRIVGFLFFSSAVYALWPILMQN